MTFRQLKWLGLLSTGLVFVNLLTAMASFFVPVVVTPLALKAGCVYGVVTAIAVSISLLQIYRHSHLLPPASAVYVRRLPRGGQLVLLTIIAVFGFFGVSHLGAAAYSTAVGSIGEEKFTVSSSYRASRANCHEHKLVEVSWLAIGGRAVCLSEPLDPGTILVLRGPVSEFGVVVSERHARASNKHIWTPPASRD